MNRMRRKSNNLLGAKKYQRKSILLYPVHNNNRTDTPKVLLLNHQTALRRWLEGLPQVSWTQSQYNAAERHFSINVSKRNRKRKR